MRSAKVPAAAAAAVLAVLWPLLCPWPCTVVCASAPLTVNATTSAQLRAALDNPAVTFILIPHSLVVAPADWAAPVLLTRDVAISGSFEGPEAHPGFPALATLDMNHVERFIRIGPDVTLSLHRLELINHIRHVGTANVYMADGLQAIDTAGSGPNATLAFLSIVSHVRVGLPVEYVRESIVGGADYDYYDRDYFDYAPTSSLISVEPEGSFCYTTARRYSPVCNAVVRLGSGRGSGLGACQEWAWHDMRAGAGMLVARVAGRHPGTAPAPA